MNKEVTLITNSKPIFAVIRMLAQEKSTMEELVQELKTVRPHILRQIQSLERLGIVNSEDIKTDMPGRPFKKYSLSVPQFSNILADCLIKKCKEEEKTATQSIRELKKQVNTNNQYNPDEFNALRSRAIAEIANNAERSGMFLLALAFWGDTDKKRMGDILKETELFMQTDFLEVGFKELFLNTKIQDYVLYILKGAIPSYKIKNIGDFAEFFFNNCLQQFIVLDAWNIIPNDIKTLMRNVAIHCFAYYPY